MIWKRQLEQGVFLFALGLAISVIVTGVHAAPAKAAKVESVLEDGHLLATRQCSLCHAVEKTGASPRPDAPPFRYILSGYHGEVLRDELVEGIKVGHPDMPKFQLNPAAVDALLAYLRSIQTPQRKTKN